MKLRPTLFAAFVALGAAVAHAAPPVRPEIRNFAAEMAQRHGFDQETVERTLAEARYEARVINLIQPPTKPGTRSWQRYRSRFLDRTRIAGGLAFWEENNAALEAASARFGVPPEIIVAVIGVETIYGRQTGNFQTLSALSTLAFDYPPRADLFRRELEHLFLLAREQGRPPGSYTGSYAGALGYPQFLPSSVRAYAVDFDGDGRVDFDTAPDDAIGSVANYLHVHGWIAQAPVAERARFNGVVEAAPLVAAGIEPVLSPDTLANAGITTLDGSSAAAPATLVDLETPGEPTEYWLGYRNFYVITRYNRSSFYAMSVFELAETLRRERLQRTALQRG
ncbi:putative membrane-bound lytic murein transglycosylase [Azoarcus olearius]|uniref:lytic murein transglycosylase B n=1 Tax=Azoarcus sp. (strain BH72) TaxID=418699 RepID=UPI0008063C20|nr:lytic murein transglycosylase B [Azoarcus olearius]ANQ84256.1 putative membrane-bound lytic murein transglycosylase [Azoarcus olearius]